MSDGTAHDKAMRLARSSNDEAKAIAKSIKDPHLRARALAWVARYAPDGRVAALGRQAFEDAVAGDDPYEAVEGAAWPLRAMVERGGTDRIEPLLKKLAPVIEKIEPPGRRAEPVLLVFQAVHPAGRRYWERYLSTLAGLAQLSEHWRVGRALRDAIKMIAADEPDFAQREAERIADERLRRKVLNALERSDFQQPRDFFWDV